MKRKIEWDDVFFFPLQVLLLPALFLGALNFIGELIVASSEVLENFINNHSVIIPIAVYLGLGLWMQNKIAQYNYNWSVEKRKKDGDIMFFVPDNILFIVLLVLLVVAIIAR